MHTVLNRRKSRWYPKHEVRGSLLEKLQGEKGGSDELKSHLFLVHFSVLFSVIIE